MSGSSTIPLFDKNRATVEPRIHRIVAEGWQDELAVNLACRHIFILLQDNDKVYDSQGLVHHHLDVDWSCFHRKEGIWQRK